MYNIKQLTSWLKRIEEVARGSIGQIAAGRVSLVAARSACHPLPLLPRDSYKFPQKGKTSQYWPVSNQTSSSQNIYMYNLPSSARVLFESSFPHTRHSLMLKPTFNQMFHKQVWGEHKRSERKGGRGSGMGKKRGGRRKWGRVLVWDLREVRWVSGC